MAPSPGIRIFAPNRLLIVCVVATTLPNASAAVMCVVCALSSCLTPAPHACARFGSIAARRSAGGERDLQHLGQQMDRLGGSKPHRTDVVAFEDVQHLRDMHAGG